MDWFSKKSEVRDKPVPVNALSLAWIGLWWGSPFTYCRDRGGVPHNYSYLLLENLYSPRCWTQLVWEGISPISSPPCSPSAEDYVSKLRTTWNETLSKAWIRCRLWTLGQYPLGSGQWDRRAATSRTVNSTMDSTNGSRGSTYPHCSRESGKTPPTALTLVECFCGLGPYGLRLQDGPLVTLRITIVSTGAPVFSLTG